MSPKSFILTFQERGLHRAYAHGELVASTATEIELSQALYKLGLDLKQYTGVAGPARGRWDDPHCITWTPKEA